MSNLIETATIFQTELDRAAVEQATSGWMELNSGLVKYNGGAEVKIPKLSMDGLADYDRDKGFVEGSINLKYQTKELTMDRGRKFTLDENDVDESNFVLQASSVMGDFQRDYVIPELDAYRYSAIAAGAIAHKQASGGYTPTETDVLKELYRDIARVQDIVGDTVPLVITMSTKVAVLLDMSTQIGKSISAMDFKQGDVTLKVRSLNGEYPIIRVGSGRMKTAYVFKDGTTDNQKSGGFEPAPGAKDVNWIICPKNAPIAVSKTDTMRIFDPETYQDKRAWAMDFRKFHDVWIPDNKWNSIWVNLKDALPEGGGAV